MNLHEFLALLEGVRKSGNGWIAKCPGHEDHRQSLSVSQGEKGILLKCFAGCGTKDLLSKIGLKEGDLFPSTQPLSRSAHYPDAPENTYAYLAEDSSLVLQVLRFANKRFQQRRPDPSRPGGFLYKLEGVRRIPYHLPDIIEANPSQVIFVVEGEKDADNLHRLGAIATTNPGGVGGGRLWFTEPFQSPFRDRELVILPDNDNPGRKHAANVARALSGIAKSIKVVPLPGLPPKGDVSDWIANGGTLVMLQDLIEGTPPWAPPSEAKDGEDDRSEQPDEDTGKGRKKVSQARLLVAIAEENVELFKTPNNTAFATLANGETVAIRSQGFRFFLLQQFFLMHNGTASSQATKEAIDTLEMLALTGTEVKNVAQRVGAHGDCIYIDLCNKESGIVEITSTGWQITAPENVPIRFRRTSSMFALPIPTRNGDIEHLRRFLNVGDEPWRWQLLLSWLLFTFQPKGPFPVLVLQGEQGCAKSTTSRVLCGLIDPSEAELRLPPRDENGLLVAAKSSWVLAYDNLSGMQAWLSDALCCLATGTAQTKRALFTDDEEHIIKATRPVIVNGIDDMTARPDFASRALAVSLPQIRDDRRQEESTFWAEFEQDKPGILGSIFSTLSRIVAIRSQIILTSKPRMADFARFGVAAEQVLGWKPGSFMEAYQVSQADSAAVTLESSLVALAVYRFMTSPALGHTDWRDTASALLPRLVGQLEPGQERNRAWPVNPSQLGNQLRRCAPILRRYGIEVDQVKLHGERIWRLIRKEPESTVKTPPPPSPIRKPEQISLPDGGTTAVIAAPSPTLECHPAQGDKPPGDARGALGDSRVTADNELEPPRWGDEGDGGGGTSSFPSEEEKTGNAPADSEPGFLRSAS